MLPAFFTRSQGLHKLYGRMMTPLLEQYGLTRMELDILLFLANNPEHDTARDMVELRHLAKSHVSVGVDSLVRRGLLERCFREGNRKMIHLRLRDGAGEIVAAGREAQRRYGETLFQGFTGDERARLMAMLDRIGDNVSAALDQEP